MGPPSSARSEEVYTLLEPDKWYTTKDIVPLTNLSRIQIHNALAQLYARGLLRKRTSPRQITEYRKVSRG